MKGIRFYEEFSNKRKGISTGNCIAVFTEPNMRNLDGTYSGIASIYDHPNSAVASSAVSAEVLRKTCKRVTETHARAVHPQLANYLDSAASSWE